MIASLLLVPLLVVQVEKSPSSYNLEELVEAHESALGLIHQVELVMEHQIQNYKGEKPFGEPKRLAPWRWARRGQLERIRYDVGSAPREEGRPTGLYDWFMDETSVRMLQNYDSKHPQKIAPLDQGTIVARIMPRTGAAPGPRDVPRQMLWSFSVDSDDRRSLAKLVRESPHAELIGPAEIEGHWVWHVRAAHPGSEGVPQPGVYFDVYLDPAMNFAARRVVEHTPKMQQLINDKLETYPVNVVRTVKKFQDFEGGVFVPVEIEMRVLTGSTDSRKSVTLTHIKALVINGPLSHDALDFRFPEHTQVVYWPPVSTTKQRVELWGPNNRAIKEINSPKDLPGYEEARKAAEALQAAGAGRRSEPRRVGRQWFLWGNLLLIGCLVLYFIFRHIRK